MIVYPRVFQMPGQVSWESRYEASLFSSSITPCPHQMETQRLLILNTKLALRPRDSSSIPQSLIARRLYFCIPNAYDIKKNYVRWLEEIQNRFYYIHNFTAQIKLLWY